jgi:quercetin dioxygenase-like cupin family protein
MPNGFIAAADAPVFELPGIRFTSCAAPGRGAKESAVWIVEIAAGTPGGVHRLTREEIIVVLQGRATAVLDADSIELGVGDTLIVPKDRDFSLANPFADPFHAVAVLPVGGQAIQDGKTFSPPWTV